MEQFYFSSKVVLLQRDETGRVCGSNPGAAVLHGLVGDGELSKVVTTHFRLQKREMKGNNEGHGPACSFI